MPWISARRWHFVVSQISAIHRRLNNIAVMENIEMANMKDVAAKVRAQTNVIESVETLLLQLRQQLADAMAANDPAAVQDVIDQLDANTNRLANDVVANTSAAPAPKPVE